MQTPPLTIDTLRDRRAKLAAERREIEKQLPQARATLAAAEAEFVRLNTAQLQDFRPRDAAAIARRKAQAVVSNLDAEAALLDKQLANLSRLLTGKSRAEEAGKTIAATADALKAAEERQAHAAGTLSNLVALIEAEGRSIDAARQQAAAKVLEAVKAGTDPAAAAVVNRDQLAAYEVAKDAAHAELRTAQAAVDAAAARHAAAMKEQLEALADDAELQHQIARAGYVAVVARAMAAAEKAGRPFDVGVHPGHEAAGLTR